MKIDVIRNRLQQHRPVMVEGTDYARAAVAVILREAERGTEFVVIRRSERRDDPWSGHMALPGGRQDSMDKDLFTTATRETREEVGIDLERQGELLGHLDDLRAVGRGRPLDLIITPFVCGITAPVTLTPNRREVETAFWLPLASLRAPETQGSFQHVLNGQQLEHQAFVYDGH